MSLGVFAILLAVNSDDNNLLIPASLLVIIAALTDRLDGKVARMLDVTSELGKQLDSLSDLISFGVAPVIISWKITFMASNFSYLGLLGYVLSVIFPMAGAYRLARYNITSFDSYYRGMPITIAGAFLAIDCIYNTHSSINGSFSWVNILITVLLMPSLSYMMISKIKIKKV
jgi:CDP-diacylglycerol--serine O-phosphatidyltransferase